MRRVKAILHSLDNTNAGSTVLMLEKYCLLLPLKQKLGRLKRDCNDMRQLMAAPESDDDKPGKGKKSGNTKG